MKISDWSDADVALAHLAERRRILAKFATERDEAISKARDVYLKRVRPWEDEIEALESELHRFALDAQGDLDGRSKTLTHGRLGFHLARELAVRSVKKAIDWLVESKKWAYLRVRHELNKEALRDADPDILKACGAKLKPHDQFWYEIDDARHVVED
jgi:phage host-nuclease inhibitor protein Gam